MRRVQVNKVQNAFKFKGFSAYGSEMYTSNTVCFSSSSSLKASDILQQDNVIQYLSGITTISETEFKTRSGRNLRERRPDLENCRRIQNRKRIAGFQKAESLNSDWSKHWETWSTNTKYPHINLWQMDHHHLGGGEARHHKPMPDYATGQNDSHKML